jgi:hypothetical protein
MSLIITIHPAENADNPRTWYHYSIMVCHHASVELPNECPNPIMPRAFDDWVEMKRYLIKVHHASVILPVYMNTPTGGLSTTPFKCWWDSVQVGWIYATRGNVMEVAGVTRLTHKARRTATADLVMEVSVYSKYLMGAVYDVQLAWSDGTNEWLRSQYDRESAKKYLEPQYHAQLDRAVTDYFTTLTGHSPITKSL